MIANVDEVGWKRAVTVPIARPPPRPTQVHRLSCFLKIVRTILNGYPEPERNAGQEWNP
jgi:type IV secretory pathway TrbF-like protein